RPLVSPWVFPAGLEGAAEGALSGSTSSSVAPAPGEGAFCAIRPPGGTRAPGLPMDCTRSRTRGCAWAKPTNRGSAVERQSNVRDRFIVFLGRRIAGKIVVENRSGEPRPTRGAERTRGLDGGWGS